MYQLSSYGILLIAACVFVEGLLRLPIMRRVRLMGQILTRVRFVLSASLVSDHWKERALLAYAYKLWMDSAILFLYLLLLGTPLLLVLHLCDRVEIFNPEILYSAYGLFLATLAGTVYGFVRSRRRRTVDVRPE